MYEICSKRVRKERKSKELEGCKDYSILISIN